MMQHPHPITTAMRSTAVVDIFAIRGDQNFRRMTSWTIPAESGHDPASSHPIGNGGWLEQPERTKPIDTPGACAMPAA